MVKKESHKNNWLIIVVAMVAAVALILGAVSMTKANVTGEAIKDWFRKSNAEKVQEQTQATSGTPPSPGTPPSYQKVLWAHDGKNCYQECTQQLGSDWKCVHSLVSFVEKFHPVTREYLCGQNNISGAVDFVYNDAPQACSTVYEMRQNITDCGPRAMYCTCMEGI